MEQDSIGQLIVTAMPWAGYIGCHIAHRRNDDTYAFGTIGTIAGVFAGLGLLAIDAHDSGGFRTVVSWAIVAALCGYKHWRLFHSIDG